MPVINFFTPRFLGPKDWGTELLIAETDEFIGKVMKMRAGASGPLQYHQRKHEQFFLYEGQALVRYHDELGNLCETMLTPGASVHIPPGAVHQVEALTDCVMFEVSNPVFDDRVPVAHE